MLALVIIFGVFFEMRDVPNWSFLWSVDLLGSAIIILGGLGLAAWATSRGWIRP